jgi:serine/threonine protein kinase
MVAPKRLLEPLRRWDPEQIGPYTVLGRLGAGAMGQVFLGRSAAGRLVAVKTIKIELAEEPGFRARFAHEVAAARRVSGVFTAAVVAADSEADLPWLATAYIPAPSLSRLVRACGPLPVQTTMWLAAGCAEALESIHGAGLVHRDLKPSNVLVSPDGPRVIDFGVARATERIQLTVTRGAVGTPAFMAPEQARDTRQASVASDVYSLGAMLLFAATGHPPYQAETVMEVLVRLATEAPDLSGLPADLTGIVADCMERSPRNRPTSTKLLSRLGPLVGAGNGEGTGDYLTGPASALIAEYQNGPPLAVSAERPDTQEADATGEDATFGSHTALPPPAQPARKRRRPDGTARDPGKHPRLFSARSRERARSGDTPGSGGPERPGPKRSRPLTIAALACVGAALVAAGVFLGATLSDTSGQKQNSTVSGRFPWPPPGPPPSVLPNGRSGTPKIVLNQPYGDGNTVFVIHGSGWIPRTHVTVALAGHGVSPVTPVVDREGTFNYAINQNHEFFAGMVPAGFYQIVVRGLGRRQARARFEVFPPPSALRGPGSTTGPPAASTTPGRSGGQGRRT